jgi:hypothetical protein
VGPRGQARTVTASGLAAHSGSCTITLVIGACTINGCTDDEGAKPNNAAVFGQDFVATRGLRIRKLPPSIRY